MEINWELFLSRTIVFLRVAIITFPGMQTMICAGAREELSKRESSYLFIYSCNNFLRDGVKDLGK